MYSILKALLLPPGGLFLIMLIGLLSWGRPRLGPALVALGLGGLILLSLPYVAGRLMAGLEVYPPLSARDLERTPAQAIVVLGAGRYTDGPEYGHDDVGPLTLARIRYAAWLQKQTGLPLYISAGSPPREKPPLAELMTRVLEKEFAVPVAFAEERSRDTWQNARYSAVALRRAGIGRVLLVTHAWHLPRAVYSFRQWGIGVTPAPTYFTHHDEARYETMDWVPSARALLTSYYALHEYLGLLWYRIRFTGQVAKAEEP